MRQRIARHAVLLVMTAAALLAWQPRSAHAIPAFANRTGLPCSRCHEPVFPRLNRFGWTFRSLGYRLPGEMNKSIGPLEPAEENGEKNPAHYGIENTISIAIRGRWDDTHRQGSKTFDSPYIGPVSIHFAGPADRNFGYWGEEGVYSQSPSYNKTLGYMVLTSGSTDFTPWMRYYAGKPNNFLFGKFGQIGIDGFEGNNSSISSTASTLLTSTKVNGVSLSSQMGGSVGYVRNDDNLNLYFFNGANSITSTSGISARPGYTPDLALQYLRFIGKHSSSAQAIYYVGKTPVDAFGSQWDKFNRVYLYGNYRQPLGGFSAFNLLAGYMDGNNHKLTASGSGSGSAGTVTVGSSFNIHSYFGELDYERNSRFVPYLRYDAFHSDEYKKGAVYSGNPAKDVNAGTVGAAYMANYNTRLNLDYTNTHQTGGPNTGTLRAQFWFLW